MYDGLVVARTQRAGTLWTIPKELMVRLNISENDPVTLHFGSAQASTSVDQMLSSGIFCENVMGLSENVLNILKIPANTILSVQKIAEKEFRLGPVIGILTFNRTINGKKLGYYQKPAIINRHNGLLYVFSKQGINIEKQIISGFSYNHHNDTWNPGEFPFPDVVINRCYPNSGEVVASLESVVGTKVFNKNSRLSKMDLYNALKTDRFLSSLVPESQELGASSELLKFLERYRKVYLKPVNGLRGQGIIELTYTTENLLECSFKEDNKRHSQIFISLDDVLGAVEGLSDGEKYIVQQPVQSMKYGGNHFLIRTWAMKNGQGDWVMPGMYASTGSVIIPLRALFNNIIPKFQYSKTQLMILLEDMTLQTAQVLDRQYGPLGLLGIDILIDDSGKLWLLEANGNPGYIPVNKQREYFSWSTQIYKYQLAYASCLAGFRRTEQTNSFRPAGSSLELNHSNPLGRQQSGQENQPESGQENQSESRAERRPEDGMEKGVNVNRALGDKTIKAMVVVDKKTVQEVREVEVTPLPGLSVRKKGILTNKIKLEACHGENLEYQINTDKLNIVGYLPVRLIYEGVSVAAGRDMGLIQELSFPFLSEVEIKGLRSNDEIIGKIEIVSSTVSWLSDSRKKGSDSTAILTVKLTLDCQYTVMRQCLMTVEAKAVEDTFS